MDYDFLNDFVSNALNFADKISVKYQKLMFLENVGLKGMPIYKKVATELKNLIKRENEFYDCFSFSDDEIDYMVRYIALHYNIDFNVTIEDLMHNQNYDSLLGYRVIFKLEDLSQIVIQIEDCDMDQEEMQNQIKFQKNILKDYCLVLESFVKRYLSIEYNFRNELLYIKYMLPFINSLVEEVFLKEFDFKDQLYLDYKMYGDILGIPDLVQYRFINLQLFNRFIDEVNDYIEIDDTLFYDSQKTIIISEIILKSLSVFFDNDFIENAIADLEEHIKNNGMCFLNNRLAVANILNFSETIKKDKENFAYLSLKLPR